MNWFDLARDWNLCTVENLQKLHTKQLLKVKKSLLHNGTFGADCNSDVHPWDQYDVVFNRVKAELATRPHIPNKQESKALRISRKQAGSKRPITATRSRRKQKQGPESVINT